MAEQKKSNPTEADLNSSLRGTLRHVFPWLSDADVRHETSFQFPLGRGQVRIDGTKYQASGRSDIVLYRGDIPLAVVELKRHDLALTADDASQGLSYARMLTPMPPLVIVTNGKDTRLYETHSGKAWRPKSRSEDTFQALVANAGKVASEDLRRAVEGLMGSDANVWMQMIRQLTVGALAELTGDDPNLPFIPDFLVPRRAASEIHELLEAGRKYVLLESAPMMGKSSVLRELCLRDLANPSRATLFVEARSGGLHQKIADALTDLLGWPVSEGEARQWLRRISRDPRHVVVVAIDGMDLEDAATHRDVIDLSSSTYGPNLRLVISGCDALFDNLTKTGAGRSKTRLGRFGVRTALGPISDHEFSGLLEELARRSVMLMPGARMTPEYRTPWILAMAVRPALRMAREAPPNVSVLLPPMLGVKLIDEVERAIEDVELQVLFQGLAKAIFVDSEDRDRSERLQGESLDTFMVRRETLLRYLDHAGIDCLAERGYIRLARLRDSQHVFYVRFPELAASELAIVLAGVVEERSEIDEDGGTQTLANSAMYLPLGDVIAAQALLDLIGANGRLGFELVSALARRPPRPEPILSGRSMAINHPTVGFLGLTVLEDGRLRANSDHGELVIEADEDDHGVTYSDYSPWLILSHLAAIRMAIGSADASPRLDLQLLLEIGGAQTTLRKPAGDHDMRMLPVDEIPGIGTLLHDGAGFVEAITYSMFVHLVRDRADGEALVSAALASESIPLLNRLRLVLDYIRLGSPAPELKRWAEGAFTARVDPALHGLIERVIQGLDRRRSIH